MTVNIAVYPNVTFLYFCVVLEQLFNVEDFRLELRVRIDPLSIQVNSGD